MQTVPQVPQTHNQHQRKSCDSMQQQIMQAGTIISKLFVCNTSNEFHECYETQIVSHKHCFQHDLSRHKFHRFTFIYIQYFFFNLLCFTSWCQGFISRLVRFFKNDICWRESLFNPKVNRPKVRKPDLNSLKSVLEPMSEQFFACRGRRQRYLIDSISNKYWIWIRRDHL